MLLLSAFGLGVAYCAPPGGVTAEALRRGIAHGFAPALMVELGSLLGDAAWVLAALAGITVVAGSGTAQVALGGVGVALLLVLAASSLLRARRSQPPPEAPHVGGAFAVGAAMAFANPYALAFWLGVSGPLLAHRGSGGAAIFFAGFMAACVTWCFVFAAACAWGRRLLGPRFFRLAHLVCGAALAGFAGRLAWTTGRLFLG